MGVTPEEQAAFAEIVCLSFTEVEIEHLEDFANFYFPLVEAKAEIEIPEDLILDILAGYGGEEE